MIKLWHNLSVLEKHQPILINELSNNLPYGAKLFKYGDSKKFKSYGLFY